MMQRSVTRRPQTSRLRNSAGTLGTTLLVQAIGLVTGAIAARTLGVDGRGILAALMVWSAGIANLGDLGGPVAYAYQSAEGDENRRQLARNALSIVPVQSVGLIAVGLPIVALVMSKYDGYGVLAIAYFSGFIPLNLFTRYMIAIHQGSQDFRKFNLVRIALTASYAVALVVLFVAGVNQVKWVAAALLASNVVAALVVVRGLDLKGAVHQKFNRAKARATFSYGMRAHIGNLTPIDSMQLDIALVVLFLGAREAGLYAVGIAAAGAIRTGGTAIGIVALPSVAAEPDHQRRAETIGLFFRGALVVVSLTALVAFLAAHKLVPLIYGDEFSGAIPVVQILVLGIVAAALRQVLGDCLRGAGMPMSGTVAEVASWLVAVVALATLVPLFGAVGAAWAVSASYVAALLILMAIAHSNGIAWRTLLIPGHQDRDVFRQVVRYARR
ncbi:MAG: oligosaccharide flippase family protein [Solirubrobacterales bacterium]